MKIWIRGLKNSRQKKILESFCAKVCLRVPALRKNGELSFIFLSNGEMRKVNKRFLDHDYTTDVISFGYDAPPESKGTYPFGDIYISRDFAAREALAGKYPAVQEMALYALHGTLHLIGYDDRRPADKKKMFAEQKRLFKLAAPDLAPPDHRS